MNTIQFLLNQEFVSNPIQKDTYIYDEKATNELVKYIINHDYEKIGEFVISTTENGCQIIDGQRRIKALKEFYNTGFSNLTDEEKEKFLTCPVKIVGAPAPNTKLFSSLNQTE